MSYVSRDDKFDDLVLTMRVLFCPCGTYKSCTKARLSTYKCAHFSQQ
jgi:hypothetical protein